MTIWINGKFVDDRNAIDVADRGFLLGDGLFETILVREGAPVFFAEHMARLRRSAGALRLDLLYDDHQILEALAMLAKRNEAEGQDAAVRITLTRGVGARGIDIPPSGETRPTLLITMGLYQPPPKAAPVTLMISKFRRSEHSVAASHKTLNYLDNVLARDEAARRGADDAIMLNGAGRVTCASAANVFLVGANGVVTTPSVSEGALPGVVRNVLLQSAPSVGLSIKEAVIEPSALENAPVFLTNSLMGIRPAIFQGGESESRTAPQILKQLQSCYAVAVRRSLNG